MLAVASAAAQRLVAQRWLGLLVPLQHEAFAGIKWDLLHESPAPVLPDLLYEEADSAPSVTSYSIMEDEVQVRARISQREHGPGPVRACARCRLVSLRCRAHRPRASAACNWRWDARHTPQSHGQRRSEVIELWRVDADGAA